MLWSSGALVLTLTPPRDATASLPRLYSYSSSYSYSSTLLPLLYYYGNQPEPLAVALATDTLAQLPIVRQHIYCNRLNVWASIRQYAHTLSVSQQH